MQATRRFWAIAGTALVFLLGAVALERPLLLLGAVGLGAWLLAAQYRFLKALDRTDDRLAVDLALAPPRVVADEPTTATLGLALDDAVPVDLAATVEPPVGVVRDDDDDRGDRPLHLPAGEQRETAPIAVSAPVAGSYQFPAPTVTAVDPAGLFTQSIERGPRPTLTVEPRAPRRIHVGAGDEEVAVTLGEHDAVRLGSGIEPAEIREYTPGDRAHRIDWKATARLNRPFVREYETETDRVAALVVDHRATMDQGQPGETKLDYARQVALTFVATARRLNDPIGLYTVGDAGPTGSWRPGASPGQYETVRRQLQRLTVTGAPATRRQSVRRRSPAAARAALAALEDDDSPFARSLRPFVQSADPYVARIEGDPLFETGRTLLDQLPGRVWTVLFTDDANRAELRETVKLARRGDRRVLVFLTPTCLFERGGLGDLEAAYDRYVAFEEFRRSLDRFQRVTAREVAPGDRLDAVLQAGRGRRESQGVMQ